MILIIFNLVLFSTVIAITIMHPMFTLYPFMKINHSETDTRTEDEVLDDALV